MAFGRWTTVLAGGLLLAVSLRAQQYEPTTLGLQVRGSLPMGQLKEAVAGGIPGLGASLVMEDDFLDGYRGRVVLGADQWFKGNLDSVPGSKGGVFAAHLGIEGVRLLRPYEDYPLLGPFVVAGIAMYAWSVTREDTLLDTSTTRRVTHAAGTFGFGWRLTSHLDVELKVLAGRVDPDFTASALLAGATWRY